ncbi:hypothetical protein SASPL_104586 [Salvia splendens]|uniref:Uncharacterized protein n=1 Tax=Salvia splendens TaxID=180675 RepID=A0A8X8YJP9_SALSN|nr:hypothetical protein SASPL_104586 [Salvia splendens]
MKKKNLSNRLVALSKRRLGLFKRASELCVLCGTEIAIIVQSLGKHFYSFGHNSTDAVIDRHLGGGEDHERDVVAAPAEFNLYRFVLKELELEKKRMKVAEEDDGGDVFWWNQGVEELELDELEQFAMALDELSKNADRRAKDLMGSFLSLSLAPPYRIALLLIKGSITMASYGSSMSATQPLIPVFKGEGYEYWSIRMQTLLRSQDLWDFVEQGYADPDEANRLRENKKKDSKALAIIQQAKEFKGDSKVIVVRLQSLRYDFETLIMKNGESVAYFLSRAMATVSQMRSCEEKIVDQTIVEKVLKSLTPKFDHVVVVIEKSKDLSVFSFEELMGFLQAHESRINRSFEKSNEKAFQVKGEFSNQKEFSTARGRGRGGFRGRGRGQSRGRGGRSDAKQGRQQGDKSHIQCHNCGKYGHVKADCWWK